MFHSRSSFVNFINISRPSWKSVITSFLIISSSSPTFRLPLLQPSRGSPSLAGTFFLLPCVSSPSRSHTGQADRQQNHLPPPCWSPARLPPWPAPGEKSAAMALRDPGVNGYKANMCGEHEASLRPGVLAFSSLLLFSTVVSH